MKKYLIAISFAFLFFSCREGNCEYEYETILINVDKAKPLYIGDSINKIVSLELTDNSLLTHIEQLDIIDKKILIFDKHRLMVFDTNGLFLYSIGQKGLGPGEYTAINSYFVVGDTVNIYDANLHKLFIYQIDGSFVNSKRIEGLIESVYPVNNKRFIGRKKYRGDKLETSTLATLDEDFNLVADIDNRSLKSGVVISDYCCTYNNNTLYWEFLNDTIFAIKETKIVPQYYVDFGKNKIPPIEIQGKELGEIIEYVNNHVSKYASGVRYVHEDKSNIRFIFTYQEKMYYARYNKNTKEASSFYISNTNSSLNVQYFMRCVDGEIILVMVDLDNADENPQLVFIGEDLMPTPALSHP